jgi:hypothetical protein
MRQTIATMVLYAWVPIVLVIFRDMKGYRALVMSYVAAWLFLPTSSLRLQNLPDLNKVSVTSLGVALAIVLFEPLQLAKYRWRWTDGLMMLFVLSPIPSSLDNSLGLWDGISNSLVHLMTWGMPYFYGRLYFDSFAKVRDLARGVFIGGLVYIPFCVVEMRMSPQFHTWVYGLRPRATLHSYRYGSWRPSVFMDTGLELGMWMTAASLLGFVLWYSRGLRRLWGMPVGPLLAALMVITVLCRSTGALLLLCIGLSMLVAIRWTRSPWLAICIAMVPVIYIPVRGLGLNDGQQIVQLTNDVFGGQRAHSLDFRFKNEDMLAARAREQPVFGWGGWGRERVVDEYGEDRSIVDGMWIVTFGKFGLLGMTTFFAVFLIAPLLACLRFGRSTWHYADSGPVVAIGLLLLLYMVDCLLNAMDNAVYAIGLGAVATLLGLPDRQLMPVPGWEPLAEDTGHGRPRRLWPPRPRPHESAEPVAGGTQRSCPEEL